MKLQFQTSIPGFIEGRVIEVETLTPDIRQFLRNGVLVIVSDGQPEVAVVESSIERAVQPTARRRRQGAAAEWLPTSGQ